MFVVTNIKVLFVKTFTRATKMIVFNVKLQNRLKLNNLNHDLSYNRNVLLYVQDGCLFSTVYLINTK